MAKRTDLIEYRAEYGYSQDQMAEFFGCARNRYWEVEQGKRDLTKNMMRAGWASGIPARLLLAPATQGGDHE